MREFKGILISPGIGIGKAFVYIEENFPIPSHDISPEQVQREFERFEAAAKKAAEEIVSLKKRMAAQVSEPEWKFLDAHLLMLRDPEFSSAVARKLQETRRSVEWVVLKVAEELTDRLNAAGDDYLQERSVDLRDVTRRILDHLLYRERISLADLPPESIVVAHNLLPSDAVTLSTRMVAGIAMDMGGRTSHTAILARAFEIPAVLGLSDITRYVQTGDEVIVDGNRGVVIVRPEESVKSVYLAARDAWRKRERQLLDLNELPAETLDGKRIRLEANIEVPEEVSSALAHGADGIGLYRSEFLFIQPNRFPTEEEQYRAYRRVLESMPGRSITIRTEESKEELRREGTPFREDIPVGIMIEVPSAAFTSDILARAVDFFSLGTNDLIQYTIAVDRENQRIAYLYEPFHPAVLRIIKLVVDNAHSCGIPVGMCGEMAGDVNAALVLLGLGLDELSMSAISIPEVKRIVRSVTLAEAEQMVSAVMEMNSYREIGEFVQRWMEERFDLVAY